MHYNNLFAFTWINIYVIYLNKNNILCNFDYFIKKFYMFSNNHTNININNYDKKAILNSSKTIYVVGYNKHPSS